MRIEKALSRYLKKKEYFDPDYKRENEILNAFKNDNDQQIIFLKEILINPSSSWPEKYFVADLLYLYEHINEDLFDPLIATAIDYKDPSFNRIFLYPCLQAFGRKAIATKLCEKFDNGSIIERLGIISLIYWIRPESWLRQKVNSELLPLYKKALTRTLETDNLIELYYYKLYLPKEIEEYSSDIEPVVQLAFNKFQAVPEGADALVKAIQGQADLEDLLFNKLNWDKD